MTNGRNRFLTHKKIITLAVVIPLGYVAYLLICAVKAPGDDPVRVGLRSSVSSSVGAQERLDADLRRLDAISTSYSNSTWR